MTEERADEDRFVGTDSGPTTSCFDLLDARDLVVDLDRTALSGAGR